MLGLRESQLMTVPLYENDAHRADESRARDVFAARFGADITKRPGATTEVDWSVSLDGRLVAVMEYKGRRATSTPRARFDHPDVWVDIAKLEEVEARAKELRVPGYFLFGFTDGDFYITATAIREGIKNQGWRVRTVGRTDRGRIERHPAVAVPVTSPPLKRV